MCKKRMYMMGLQIDEMGMLPYMHKHKKGKD